MITASIRPRSLWRSTRPGCKRRLIVVGQPDPGHVYVSFNEHRPSVRWSIGRLLANYREI